MLARRPLAFLALLALVLSALPTVTPAHIDLPLVAGGGGPGSGWVALKIRTDGSPVSISVVSAAVEPPGQTGLYFYDAERDIYTGGLQVLILGSMGKTMVDVNPMPGVTFREEVNTLPNGYYGGGASSEVCGNGCPGPRTLRVLLLTSGNAQSWSWEVRGGSGVQVLGAEHGVASFAGTGREFDGVAHAQVYSLGFGTHADALRTKTLAAENLAFVTFFAAPYGPHALAYTDPAGTTRTTSGFVTGAGAAGTWKFDILAGGGAGPSNFQEVYLGFADVRLPK